MHKQNEWPVPPGGRATRDEGQDPLMTSHAPCSLAIPVRKGGGPGDRRWKLGFPDSGLFKEA